MKYLKGSYVEIRTASGEWKVATLAANGSFMNNDYVWRGVEPWRVVRVELANGDVINWPEADVRAATVRRSRRSAAEP